MTYIQRKCNYTRKLETVDQFETYREAREMVAEYRLADPSAHYYLSRRSCKDWHAKPENLEEVA